MASPPDDFTKPCIRPVLLPVRELTQAEVEAFWIQDRSNLISCGYQIQALIDFYVKRDEGLTDND